MGLGHVFDLTGPRVLPPLSIFISKRDAAQFLFTWENDLVGKASRYSTKQADEMITLSVLTKIDLCLLPLLLLASFLAALDKVRTAARSSLPSTSTIPML